MSVPNLEETRFVEIVFPEQANHYGTLFGGSALNLMSKAAAIAAARRAGGSVVMASSEKVDFHMPVRVGQLVELNAKVTRVGRCSMTVKVDVLAETFGKKDRKLAMQGSFEMVSVDATGRPAPIAAI